MYPAVGSMVMSQGTYTFLACFAGFWLVWALIVVLCCFCGVLQRRLKRRREERQRERCLRTLEMEPLECRAEPPQFGPPQILPVPVPVPHSMVPSTWSSPQGTVGHPVLSVITSSAFSSTSILVMRRSP